MDESPKYLPLVSYPQLSTPIWLSQIIHFYQNPSQNMFKGLCKTKAALYGPLVTPNDILKIQHLPAMRVDLRIRPPSTNRPDINNGSAAGTGTAVMLAPLTWSAASELPTASPNL